MSSHSIYHMASFSRSGETVMLRCLNAHPALHVVHQIMDPDVSEDMELFRFLKDYQPGEVASTQREVKAAKVPAGKALMLKNAVWTHQFPFKGFVLVRNPLSVVNSFKLLKEGEEKIEARKKQLCRWARQIDEQLIPAVRQDSNMSAVCMLYNRKMAPLARMGLPIVRYEDFVNHPERILRGLFERLGLPWDDAVLRSHENYAEGSYGHGHIPLWQPIHDKSADSWKKLPPGVVSRIYGMTYPVMRDFGYDMIDKQLVLRNDIENLVI